MRKFLNIFAVTIFTFTLANAAFAADSTASGSSAAVSPAPSGIVNINTAEPSQLAYLPRVGVKAAQAIIEYRKEHGPFKKTSDLMQVKGFGEKRFKTLGPWLTVDGKTTLSAKAHAARKSRSPRNKPTTSAS
jgi:competence protein ComEA